MELRVLCVHGVGNHPTGGPREGRWKASIEQALQTIDGEVVPLVEFVHLDDIFARHPIGFLDVLEAFAKLAKSATASLFRSPKSVGDQLRWTAGMVVQWVDNETLRRQTRDELTRRIGEFEPDLIIGHSLGSLVCYDAFTGEGAQLLRDRRFVSCGSQIGNPFVVGNFAAGRLTGLPAATFWYHLFNAEDDVFTAEIRLSDPNFAQIDTFFDIQSAADHDVTEYMRHRRTVDTVWSDAVMALRQNAIPRAPPATETRRSRAGGQLVTPKARALLIGVNEYADPALNLEGCVNDVFLMSSVLQESGFAAEDIRVVLDRRATRQGIVERIDWLLDGAEDGDVRFLYYSGHGAQLPVYGVGERVDRLAETLVPHDFDWSLRTAYTDGEFQALYSQLPYGARFVSMFDCCYAAGMTRTPGHAVRGIDPPDDIRHRMLQWDAKREMWAKRGIAPANPSFDRKLNGVQHRQALCRPERLGQAMSLRTMAHGRMKAAAAGRGHRGPYLPVLVYAAREDQLSYEYRHGALAYGAFTYCLAKTLRRDRRLKQPKLTFEALVATVGKELAALGYAQQPTLVAPSDLRASKMLTVG